MNFQVLTIVLVVAGFALVVYFLSRRPKTDPGMQVMLEWLKEMRGSSEVMQKRLDETNKTISDRLDNAARFIGDLKKELGGMSQIGPDIRRLSEVLASPKARGNFGEEMLEELLRQVLPKTAYEFQYKFRSGEVVDAMVRVGDHILPIDSKFSLENFRLYKEAKTEDAAAGLKKALLKDIKKRVDEIQKKYILPQEGTFDFALMYVPSEGLYSEVSEDPQIVSYAREKRVFLVSPQNLYLHLQVILLGLKREQISEKAGQILAMITGIKQESEKFGRNLEILASHVKNSGNTMGVVLGDFAKLKTAIGNAANLELQNPPEGRTGDKLLE
jgi:DNA recombination protein RmuC